MWAVWHSGPWVVGEGTPSAGGEPPSAVMKGAALGGKKYVPLFDYYKAEMADKAFKVMVDTYVTDDSGTGVVHQAPATYPPAVAGGYDKHFSQRSFLATLAER